MINPAYMLLLVTAIIILLLVLTVISIYMKRQQRLEEFNTILENRVKERTEELKDLNLRLKEKVDIEVNKSKEKDKLIIAQSRHAAMGEMIAMIAHQWRQPLGAISMDTGSMMIDIEMNEINKEAFKEYTEGIIEQTEHLSKTIDDFRNFFRQDKDKEEILLSEVVYECFKIMSDSLKAHNIKYEVVTCQSEKTMKIYSRELLQVLLNIINNAKEALLDAKTEDATIVVDINQEDDVTTIEICDNGAGISEDALPHIFEPYFTTKETKDGTGLGLYMSKMIIETNLKGKLSLFQKEKKTCFSIVLNR